MLSRRLPSSRALTPLAVTAFTTFVLIDLVTFHAPLYENLYIFQPPHLTPAPSFVRVRDSHTQNAEGLYRVGYENYRANQGTTDLCNPYLVQRGIAARGAESSNPLRPYFGEATLTGAGMVHDVMVKPARLTVALEPRAPGWLLVNQNFFPGWRTTPPREVTSKDGLLASRVLPSDTTMTFTYAPLSFPIGALVSIGALAGVVRVLRGRDQRNSDDASSQTTT